MAIFRGGAEGARDNFWHVYIMKYIGNYGFERENKEILENYSHHILTYVLN